MLEQSLTEVESYSSSNVKEPIVIIEPLNSFQFASVSIRESSISPQDDCWGWAIVHYEDGNDNDEYLLAVNNLWKTKTNMSSTFPFMSTVNNMKAEPSNGLRATRKATTILSVTNIKK